MRELDINQVPSGRDEEWTTTSLEDEGETNNGNPPRKKLRLTKEQFRLLEESFRDNHTLNPERKEDLALQLKLKPRQVEVWFQNRRARYLPTVTVWNSNDLFAPSIMVLVVRSK